MSDRLTVLGNRAIVIGGSITGLLTAKILTKYFKQVTIVDRDSFPKQPQPRSGIPQCTQLHILLTKGRQIMEELFPGLEAELLDRGAVAVDMIGDVKWLNPFGWAVRFPSGFMALSFSRYILDWLIIERLVKIDRIEFIEWAYVTELVASQDKKTVTGVKIKQRDLTEQWYLERVIYLTTTAKNPRTTIALTEVFHMLKSVGILFQPRIVLQVLKQTLSKSA